MLEQQHEALADAARRGEQDSKTLRALTIAATLYLPASLVATIFSSNLIQTQLISSPHVPTYFVISPQFWIYVLSTLVLMLLTFWGTWYLRHLYLRVTP